MKTGALEDRPGPGEPKVRESSVLALLSVFMVVYIGGLAFLFPAELGWRLVHGMIPEAGRPAMTAIRGTLWRGQAQGLEIGGQPIGTLAWNWRPVALLRGHLRYALELESDAAYLEAKVSVGWRTLEVNNLSGTIELAQLQGRMDFPVLLAGRVGINARRFQLDHSLAPLAIEANVVWEEAAMGLPQVFDLGNYSAQLSTRDGGVVASVAASPGSALGAEGELTWRSPGDLQVDLVLSPLETLAPTLRGAVESLGRPDGLGRVRMRFEQRISF